MHGKLRTGALILTAGALVIGGTWAASELWRPSASGTKESAASGADSTKGGATPKSAPVELRERLGERAELRALRDEVTELRASLTELQRGADTEGAPSAPEQPQSHEQLMAQAKAEVAYAKAFYDDRHDSEVRDPSWSRQQEAQIREYVSSTEIGLTGLESVDCRSSQCRLVFREVGSETRQGVAEMWGRGPFRFGGFFSVDEATGLLTAYTGREGQPFPQPDLGRVAMETND